MVRAPTNDSVAKDNDSNGNLSGRASLYTKTQFSMVTDKVAEHISGEENKEDKTEAVLICGVEAHVCVLQTVLDLRSRGIKVFVATDGVYSQRDTDRVVALERMRDVGAILTTSESVIYEIMGDAKHERFKAVLPFVKEHAVAIAKL